MPGHDLFGELLRDSKYEEVLQGIVQIEAGRGLSPGELVLKGRCLQLSDAPVAAANLKEAEAAFRAALYIDKDYVPALLDLAWFYHAVEDDSGRALPFFERALEISQDSLREAVKGKMRCLEEIDSPDAAQRFLAQMAHDVLKPEEFEEDGSDE